MQAQSHLAKLPHQVTGGWHGDITWLDIGITIEFKGHIMYFSCWAYLKDYHLHDSFFSTPNMV